MTEHQDFTGETLEAALQRAADSFRRVPSELKYEVLRETRGFLGVGFREVSVRVEVPTAPAARAGVRPERAPRRAAPRPHANRAPASRPVESRPVVDFSGNADAEDPSFEVPSGPDPTAMKVGELAAELVRVSGLDLTSSMAEHEDRIAIELAGPDRELLLDRRGDTLNGVQYLLNRMARKSLGTLKRIQVESEGFRSDRDEEIRVLAVEAAGRVLQSGREERLPPLNPYERRIVHVAISEHGGVTSESEGDGFIKRVTVRPTGGSSRPRDESHSRRRGARR